MKPWTSPAAYVEASAARGLGEELPMLEERRFGSYSLRAVRSVALFAGRKRPA